MWKDSTLLAATLVALCVSETHAFVGISPAFHHRPLHLESHSFRVQRGVGGSTSLGSSVSDSIIPVDAEDEPVISAPAIPLPDEAQRRESASRLALLGISVVTAAAGATLISHPEAFDMAQQMPMQVWHSYEQTLTAAPIATKAATSATVYTIGDVIAQRTEGAKGLDYARTTRSMLAGLIGHGPLSHFWYHALDGLFENTLHLTAWWSFFPKVALDQMTWGPFWNNVYILLLGVMKLESPKTIWGDMKRTTIPLVVSGLKLWPLAHCVTYGLVPVENRLLWVDFVEILWVTILATQAAAGGPDVKVEEEGVDSATTSTLSA